MSKEKKQVIKMTDDLQEVLDLFYQQNDHEAFAKFEGILEEIAKTIDNLAEYKKKHLEFEMDEKKIYNIFDEAMQALQVKDNVLMSDIFQYDFIEYINELLDEME